MIYGKRKAQSSFFREQRILLQNHIDYYVNMELKP